MMQNISDALKAKKEERLPTFLTFNLRRHVISTTKKSLKDNQRLTETPEGAFYDLLHNAYTLLRDHCGVLLGPFSSAEHYLRRGPSHLFLYHPAIGPLYRIIKQKIRGGRIENGSELQLEIADILLNQFDLKGSFLVYARNVMGHRSEKIIRYSQQTGKCVLKNVCIRNDGIDRPATHCYWKNQIKRHQALTIVLEGHSEFYAENVTFRGSQTIIIPDKERWIAKEDRSGRIQFTRESSGWEWSYQLDGEEVVCSGQHFS